MGIQLDWQIEAERQQRQATEDPSARSRRRKQARRLLVAVLVLAAVVCVVVGGILWRLRDVENQLRQDLLDTVDAELRALRIGDADNYMAIRRSGSEYWLDLQRQTFDDYQDMKNNGRLELTERVLDVEMDLDESRARVLVEEKVDGVPHAVAWFYWRYTDEEQSGWRRVPPDIDFWGEATHLVRGEVRVEYYELDQDFAETLVGVVGEWWTQSCIWLGCQNPLPQLTIEIIPASPAIPTWDQYDDWKLVVTSPLYVGRLRLDGVLPGELEPILAEMVAQRAVSYRISPGFGFMSLPQADAAWLVEEYQAWLVGRFTGQPRSVFFESLVAWYGEAMPGMMVALVGPDAQIGPVLEAVTGVVLPSMNLEQLNSMGWERFFEWRLNLERRLLRGEIVPQDQMLAYHYGLYDESDGFALAAADTYRAGYDGNSNTVSVQTVIFRIDEGGRLVSAVTAVVGMGEAAQVQAASFRWNGITWKRVS